MGISKQRKERIIDTLASRTDPFDGAGYCAFVIAIYDGSYSTEKEPTERLFAVAFGDANYNSCLLFSPDDWRGFSCSDYCLRRHEDDAECVYLSFLSEPDKPVLGKFWRVEKFFTSDETEAMEYIENRA